MIHELRREYDLTILLEIAQLPRSTFYYHISVENEAFVRRDGGFYRVGTVYRDVVDKKTGKVLSRDLIRENNAKVMYDLTQ